VLRPEVDFWTRPRPANRLPVDFPGGENVEASERQCTVSLDSEETQALLHQAPAAYHTEINDVLLTALAQAFARWTGVQGVLVDLEGHGREDLFEDVDLSRTVGWFTTVYPVWLDLRGVEGPGGALQAVKEQLRAIPGRGIGYGLLRYLSADAPLAGRLRALPAPEVSFNYLGQFNQPEAAPTILKPAPEPAGPSRSPRAARSHLIDINGSIAGGRLAVDWSYSQAIHRQATIEQVAGYFADALRALIAHCALYPTRSPQSGGHTPSDFMLARLDQRKLNQVFAQVKKKDRLPR
jgi:non-ribosomal peptide synthase protein (TIGR01720 family)